MIHDTPNKRATEFVADEGLEFEPTVSTDVTRIFGAVVADDEDEGEQVRDDELIRAEFDPIPPHPAAPVLQVSTPDEQNVPGPLDPHGSTQATRPVPPPLRKSPASSENRLGSERLPGRAPLVERRRLRKEVISEGDLLLGKLRIDRVVSEGMTVTGEATHLHLGTRLQVVVLSHLGRRFTEAREHFMRTARVVAQMQSEHVARITEVGLLDSGSPFLVAEMPGSSDVSELIRVRGPFGMMDAVDYAIQVAEALAEAHSLGIVHGNLRPSCLRVAGGIDGWPVVKVLGFGTPGQWLLNAISLRDLGNRHASAITYLSPEQIRSIGDTDARTDVWAVGALLHEMLAGWPAFQGESPAGLLAAIVADPAPPISGVRADVPRTLESVILRCLEKDRLSRYATISDLARALQPYAPATSHAIVERIVRVMARGPTWQATHASVNTALVHVRHSGVGPKPPDPVPAQKAQSATRTALVVGGVALIGAIAGLVGAFFTGQLLKTPNAAIVAAERAVPSSLESNKTAREPALHTEVLAARPRTVPSTGVRDDSSRAAPASTAVPVDASRESQRASSPASAPRRSAVSRASIAFAAKETPIEHPETAPTKTPTDLFSDMK